MATEVATPTALDVRARIEALLIAINRHDVDAIVAMHAPDAMLESPTLPVPAKGRRGIAAEFATMFRTFPDMTFDLDTVETYVGTGGKAAAHWRWTGTMTGRMDPPGYAPTGRTVTSEGACFYAYDGELIARHTIVFDALELLHEAGLMPAIDSTSARATAAMQRGISRLRQAMRR